MTLDLNHGLAHLETVLSCHHFQTYTVLYCYHLVRIHLSVCRFQVPGHYSMTRLRTTLNVLERKQADGNFQVFDHRVGFITAGQAENTVGQDVTRNRQDGYSNRQAGKSVGQTGFISPNSWLIVYGICVKGELEHGTHHLKF